MPKTKRMPKEHNHRSKLRVPLPDGEEILTMPEVGCLACGGKAYWQYVEFVCDCGITQVYDDDPDFRVNETTGGDNAEN